MDKEQEKTLFLLMRAMIKYDGGDVPRIMERICWLIAHHHTYTNVTSQDHRILLEADFLVNSFEDHLSKEAIISFRENVFRSPSAIEMLNNMWNL